MKRKKKKTNKDNEQWNKNKKSKRKPVHRTPFDKPLRKEETSSESDNKPEEEEANKEIILNKYVALSGICSRRKAVEYIEKGDVTVNGEIIKVPYHRVQTTDVVQYKGKTIKPEEKKVYFLLNKPSNCITSLKDPEGRKTVLDIVGDACKERIYPVGRLDRNTTGLLLLTNDGDLAKKLSHPSHMVKKLYYATLDKEITTEDLDKIKAGLELEDGPVEVDAVGFVENSKGFDVGIEIHLGRNRIVRRIFEHLGYHVKRLDRMYYAGLTKKDLPRGRFRPLSHKEIIMLKHFT